MATRLNDDDEERRQRLGCPWLLGFVVLVCALIAGAV